METLFFISPNPNDHVQQRLLSLLSKHGKTFRWEYLQCPMMITTWLNLLHVTFILSQFLCHSVTDTWTYLSFFDANPCKKVKIIQEYVLQPSNVVSNVALRKKKTTQNYLDTSDIFKRSDMAQGRKGGVYSLEAACLDAGTIDILPQSHAELLQLVLHHGQLPLHYQDVLKREQTGLYIRSFMF